MLTFGHPMERIYKFILIVNTRLCFRCGLVFFLLTLLAACKPHDQKITLVWKNDLATGIQIPEYLIRDPSALREKHSVKIVRNGSTQAILGDFTTDNDLVVFTPVIPLSPGLSYTVWQDNKPIGNVDVPHDKTAAPALVAIYPQTDTLPENTLKLYFSFSKPMRSGQSLNYVCLLDKNKDTMRNVFLNLQPELWDTTSKVLTLWLDPGRIKRGLVLNKALGNPLKKAESYTLVVSQQWKDTHGISLAKNYTKHFVAGAHDGKQPNIDTWQLSTPKPGSKQPLLINTSESLDHYLLQECITVLDSRGSAVKGTIALSNNDKLWTFTPASPWSAQAYKLSVKATLEDLAGNNLNRVFDRDLTKDKQTNQDCFTRVFTVKQ